MTLTLRTTKHLRELGYLVATVEHYNSFTRRKHDLFGCIDLLAIGNGETLAIQVTSRSNMSARIKKIQDAEALPEMLRSKWRIIVHGWDRGTNGRYRLKEFEF
jgi:hypothetical protein